MKEDTPPLKKRSRRARTRAVSEQVDGVNALYEMVFRHALDGVVVHELVTEENPGHFLAANPAACALLGYTEAEMRTLTPLKIQGDGDLETVPEEKDRLLADGELLFRKHLLRKDGTRVPAELHTRLFRDEAKDYVVSVIRDLRERSAAEARLQSAERDWERTFDSVPDLVAVIDTDHGIVRVNRAMAQCLGVAPEQCAGMKCYEAVHGAEQAPASCPHTRALADGREHAAELHEERLGGDFLVTCTPVFDAAGNLTGSIHVARDISERKQAELRILRQNAVLDGINRIFREALSYETEEELGRTCLAVAESVTGSKFGFIGEVNAAGKLDDIAISDPGWDACRMEHPTGHRIVPTGFIVHGIYGRVLRDGKAFFTNDPASHPDSIGCPEGHPPLKAFLGAPLIHLGKTIGMIAVGNRDGGYTQVDLEVLETLAEAIVHAFMWRRSEAQVQSMAQFTRENPNPVLRANGEGAVLFANPPALEMLEQLEWQADTPLPEALFGLVRRFQDGERFHEVEVAGRDGRVWSFALSSNPDETHVNFYGRNITARKQVEAALRESETRFRGLAEALPQLVWQSDAQGDVLYFNRCWSEYTGLETASMEERAQLVHPDDLARAKEVWENALRTGSEYVCEYRLRRHDGEYRWFLSNAVLDLAEDGSLCGWLVTATDIHVLKQAEEVLEQRVLARTNELLRLNEELSGEVAERARAEAAVEAERKRFNDVLEMLPVYVALLAPDYHMPFANRFFRERFGESHGRKCFEFLFERCEACETCETYTVMRTNAPHHWEWMGPDGRNYDIHDFPFKDSDGSPLIMEMGIDITERKHAEAALQQAHDLLEIRVEERTAELGQASEQRRLVLEAAEMGAWDYRLDTGDVFWDAECRNQFGVPAGDHIDYRAAIDQIHPEDRTRVDEAVRRAASGENNGAYHQEFRVIWPDGSVHWIASHGRVYFEEQEEVRRPLRFIGANRDITGAKRAEEALRQQREWFRVTLSSIGDAVMTTDIDGCITFFNPVAAALTGWSAEDALGQAVDVVFQIINEETRKPAENIVRRVLQEGTIVTLANHTALITRDGREVPIEDSAAPILDRAGTVSGVVLVFHDVTEKRRAQEALREREEDLNRAQAVAHIGSWRLDVRKNELLWSAENHRIFGIPEGTPMSYETFLEVVHPDDRAFVHQQWTAALSGAPYDIEHRIVVDGAVKWVREQAELEFETDGGLLGGFGTTQDVTARKEAAVRLHRSTERFKLLSEVTAGLLGSDEPQRLVEDLCRKVLRHLDCDCFFNFLADDTRGRLHLNAWGGIPEEEALKIEWLDYGVAVCGCAAQGGCRIIAEDIQHVPDPRTELVKSFGVQAYACHPLLAQGRTIGTLSFGTRTRTTFTEDELEVMRTVANAVAVAMQRIVVQHALRQAHDELEQRVHERTQELSRVNSELAAQIEGHVRTLGALRKSEARLAAAQQMAHVGSWEWDVSTGGLACSDEVFRICGLYPGESFATYQDFLAQVHREDRAAVEETLRHAEQDATRYDIEYRIVRVDEEIRHVHMQGEAIPGEHGATSRIFGTILDITARVQAEEEARMRHQQLIQADKMVSLGILASGIAHEINNPNHAIMNNVASLQNVWMSVQPILDNFEKDFGDFVLGGFDYSESRDKFPEMYANTLASAKRIELIVQELRDSARYNPADKMAAVDVKAVVKSAVVLMSNMLQKCTDHLSIDYAEDLPPVQGNFQRLEQVIINLIQNACQALPDRSKAIYVRAFRAPETDNVVVEVRDEGAGIPEEDLRHLGDPFFTSKRASGGTGLGLWISFNIAHEHGGTLTYTSKLGEGTTAVLELPAGERETSRTVVW